MKHFTFNGCARSQVKVTPANWHTAKASVKKLWRIYYRFYDPAHPEAWGKPKAIRGMNEYTDLKGRQDATRTLLENELHLLDARGLNPITGGYMAPDVVGISTDDLSPDTGLLRALELAIPLCEANKKTKGGIANVVKFFGASARQLGKDMIPVAQVKRGELMKILQNCKNLSKTVKGREVSKVWNDNQWNYFRKYLGICYSALKIAEVMEYNPITDIPIKQTVLEEEPTREVLTVQDRERIDTHLQHYPAFRRLMHIFFHSGAREAELMRVQGKHVDLSRQRFRVLIKKRKKWAWVSKTITDTALPLWIEAVAGCGPEDFVFSKGLVPGAKPIRPDQLTKRWKRLVKDKLGITADFYSLKHSYTTDIMDELTDYEQARNAAEKEAAGHNSHTSGKMVRMHYDARAGEREHEARKKMGKGFV